MPDQILDIVLDAGNGGVLAAAARLAGLSAEEAGEACRRLVPEIAALARAKAETDQQAYDELLDLIADDSTAAVLDDPAGLASPETRADGERILAALYGTPDQARVHAGSAGPLMPLLAVLTLAAIARRGRAAMMGMAAVPDRGTGSGLLGTLLTALVAGVIKGLMQGLQNRSGSDARPGSAYGRRPRSSAPSRRRHGWRPSLEEVFGDILRRR
jgi:hypothetical protein